MNIREKYKNFLRILIDKKYLQNYKYVQVLAENLVGNYYFVLYKVEKRIWEDIKW